MGSDRELKGLDSVRGASSRDSGDFIQRSAKIIQRFWIVARNLHSVSILAIYTVSTKSLVCIEFVPTFASAKAKKLAAIFDLVVQIEIGISKSELFFV